MSVAHRAISTTEGELSYVIEENGASSRAQKNWALRFKQEQKEQCVVDKFNGSEMELQAIISRV